MTTVYRLIDGLRVSNTNVVGNYKSFSECLVRVYEIMLQDFEEEHNTGNHDFSEGMTITIESDVHCNKTINVVSDLSEYNFVVHEINTDGMK